MRSPWIVAAVVVLGGCTHATEFVHEKPRHDAPAPVLSRSVTIAVSSSPKTNRALERRVVDELRLAPSVGLVAARRAGAEAEYLVELHVERRAMSRGTNFLICWPGFIVFAPAWHGLEWPYRVNTRALITRADGSPVADVQRSDLYTVYKTSSEYGIGAGLGWFPPFWSFPALVTGIVSSWAPEERQLHYDFLVLESEEWAHRVAMDVLRAIASDPEPPAAPGR